MHALFKLLIMWGVVPTLKDIILEKLSDPVELVPEELHDQEEETEQVQLVTKEIIVTCFCGTLLSISVACSGETLLQFEQLILENLTFLCGACVEEQQNG